MELKYSLLFGWSLVLLAMVIFIIRGHRFIRRKKDGNLNHSESLYVVALLVSAVLVLGPVLDALLVDFDITLKFYNDRFLVTLVTSGSLVSLAGIAMFVVLFVTARGMSTLFFYKRIPLVEFDTNNLAYSIVRSGLLVALGLLLSPCYRPVYEMLLPTVSTPFYR
jgi:hypothetical protein